MTDSDFDGRVRRLLSTSLPIWGVQGTLESVAHAQPQDDTTWIARIVTASGIVVTIGRATGADGQRLWRIARRGPGESDEQAKRDHRSRMHASVSGLLRGVRGALDAPSPSGRLILTPRPLLG